jgi:hypothetical protein
VQKKNNIAADGIWNNYIFEDPCKYTLKRCDMSPGTTRKRMEFISSNLPDPTEEEK